MIRVTEVARLKVQCRLIMDLHKPLNAMQAELAVETLDGCYHLQLRHERLCYRRREPRQSLCGRKR